jgi:hypothetical protein
VVTTGSTRRFGLLGVILVVVCAAQTTRLEGQGALVRLEAAPGSKASYRVREQLAGFDLPNDAVGTTGAIAGSLVLASDGTFDRERSRLTLDLAMLTSDQSMRDNYVRTRTLEVEKFPKAEFALRRVQGLTLPLASDRVTGRATTSFPFSTFGRQIPKLARLLSVDDNIRLELDLVLTRSSVQ